ncbi:GATOR complex protein WDR24 [Eumeta japonica]|uniref:GATOR2 complex protein WDR24 n=1 Tax=Eumeta variegata TaxID=151549 RepID=A0A4C1TQ47_EUMVA|nr:GATOR complex protein WDR24 [Eumeta japonica]
MLSANTICVSQEGPANALALNKDYTQVVIAGRNVFKVFSIVNDEFSEVCNLRVGKNLNLNFSSIDVAWSAIEENTLATAATNGAVVVWNLGKQGRSKQEHVFSDHKRTVNKVSFHLTEPALLISGSQDGTMKCFDLRMKEVARTFLSNTESVRDVQFSPHQAHTFAAVSENGSVQVWDVRRAERCLQQFTAHSGPVFACDWHPEQTWLATASRDKTIKVWDLHAKPTLEYTIYTIASVGHVKWRPQKKYHIASCALVLDSTINVWDIRRPHIPFATFAEHRDVTTAIAWQGDPDVFLSTSRDCTLYRHKFREAAHPVLWANPQGVCVSARGEVAQAAAMRPLPPLPPSSDGRPPAALGRKQPTAGSLSINAQSALERAFSTAAATQLTRWTQNSSKGEEAPFIACARAYKLRGSPPHILAKHNAQVARDVDRHTVAHVWEVLAVLYEKRSVPEPAPQPPAPEGAPPPPLHEPHPPHAPADTAHYNSVVEEEPLVDTEESMDNQFQYSGVLGLPTADIYIPRIKHHTPDGEVCGWVSAATAHYVDPDAMDWTLPEEAFTLRTPHHHDPEPDGAAHANDHNSNAPLVVSSSPGALSGGSSSASSGSGQNVISDAPSRQNYTPQSSVTTVEDGVVGPLRVRGDPADSGELDAAPLLASALKLHADLGDVQTGVCVLMALADYRVDLFPYIDEALQEHWLLGYIELLQRHKLWNLATEIIRGAWVYSVWQSSQQSTTVQTACARCGRRLRAGHAPCDRCAAQHSLCAVCHQVVRGLFAWCQGCAHGGHLHHIQKWMEQHSLCPAGCGHHCQLGRNKSALTTSCTLSKTCQATVEQQLSVYNARTMDIVLPLQVKETIPYRVFIILSEGQKQAREVT